MIAGSSAAPAALSLEEVHSSVPIPQSWWRRFLAFSRAGVLVSVGYMDPGNWGTDLRRLEVRLRADLGPADVQPDGPAPADARDAAGGGHGPRPGPGLPRPLSRRDVGPLGPVRDGHCGHRPGRGDRHHHRPEAAFRPAYLWGLASRQPTRSCCWPCKGAQLDGHGEPQAIQRAGAGEGVLAPAPAPGCCCDPATGPGSRSQGMSEGYRRVTGYGERGDRSRWSSAASAQSDGVGRSASCTLALGAVIVREGLGPNRPRGGRALTVALPLFLWSSRLVVPRRGASHWVS